MHKYGIVAVVAMMLWGGVAFGQAAPPAPAGKAGYFANSDIQGIWKDLETRQVLNKRVLEGGTHSINIRIVKPTDPPLVHANSLDNALSTLTTTPATWVPRSPAQTRPRCPQDCSEPTGLELPEGRRTPASVAPLFDDAFRVHFRLLTPGLTGDGTRRARTTADLDTIISTSTKLGDVLNLGATTFEDRIPVNGVKIEAESNTVLV